MLNDIDYTQQDYEFIKRLLYKKAGIDLGDTRKNMVYRRCSNRIKDLGLHSFKEYCDFLKVADQKEITCFINALTTNLTSFYREKRHFAYLEKFLIDKINNKDFSKVTIWSSACSTGEEPYSIAFTIYKILQRYKVNFPIRIIATDLDTEVLKKAQAGIYDIEHLERIPNFIQKNYLLKGRGPYSGYFRIKQDIKKLISFKRVNLIEEWSFSYKFSIIFCRNVMIYFDELTQNKIYMKFHQALDKEGILILGHSESLNDIQKHFRSLGNTTFVKK